MCFSNRYGGPIYLLCTTSTGALALTIILQKGAKKKDNNNNWLHHVSIRMTRKRNYSATVPFSFLKSNS